MLAAGNGTDNEEWFGTRRDGVRQWGVGRLVREIVLASEKAQERTTLSGGVITDGPAQHGIAGFEGVENGSLGDRGCNFNLYLGADPRQGAQMLRENDSDWTRRH